ncbi:ABC transporter ATP-binding protein [Clostridium sp. C8-1-8]|uniref:ABC transporter ATP-binding protein n=1 Tax=Clostridium sp. C8-1-8 TaxID=2698831 RepID=UPI00136FC64C|nr:ABC transporter ATP-binding protein [Clostridium sp. C8-1-8]
MSESLIQVENVNKTFGEKKILDNLTFHVNKGEVLGILGPNGAGKSTTFNVITGLLKADSGTVKFEDNVVLGSKAYKTRLGVVPQDISLYEDMTVEENLRLIGKLYGIRGNKLNAVVEKLVKDVHLSEKKKTEIKKLSGGMKRRVNIAAAILHDPALIIMDEPTVGIDPQSRSGIWDIINSLREQGKSIILTSHYVDEVERLSDRVLIIDTGKVIAEGSVNSLIKSYCNSKIYTIEFYSLDESFINEVKNIPSVESVDVQENKVKIISNNEKNILEDLVKISMSLNLDIKNIDFKKPSLEDVFFYFTGRGLRE